MSNAPPPPSKKRCPNCAWAIGLAHALELPHEESWILTVIAEHVGPDMRFHATMGELGRLTRIKPVTLSKHVKSLASRKVGIEIERSRDGYHYTLLRPPEAVSKPTARPRMPYDDVAEEELQNLQFPDETVADEEFQNLCLSTPGITNFAIQDPPKFAIPSNEESLKTPLKEESKEESSLRSDARASNVVDLIPDRVQTAVAVWNEVCVAAGSPAIRELSPVRRKRIQALMTTRFNEPAAWRQFCQEIAGSDFLISKGLGIDWAIKPANVIKILEGNYRNRAHRAAPRAGTLAAFTQAFGIGAMQPTLDPEDDSTRRISP